ncbi:DinB family protein [Aquirufa regiilacus]
MNKQALIKSLTENHLAFVACINELSAEDFNDIQNEKWTAGQQLEHIYLSVKPVNLAFKLPAFLLKLIWGKANRASRSYDELIERYHAKLANGSKATGPFVPKSVDLKKGQQLKANLKNVVSKLCLSLNTYSEDELDQYILPHPLLGKLTLREMLFFTIYHVQHHENLIINQVSERPFQK